MQQIEVPVDEKIRITWVYPNGTKRYVTIDSDILRLTRVRKLNGVDPLEILGEFATKRQTGNVSIGFEAGDTSRIATIQYNENHKKQEVANESQR